MGMVFTKQSLPWDQSQREMGRWCAGDKRKGEDREVSGWLPVQLGMKTYDLGIVSRIQNNSWQQKHKWPRENSWCKRPWILCLCSEKGPNKGTKQTSGHNCLPFKGATDHSAYGVWRSQNARAMSFGVTLLVPEAWEPDEHEADWKMRWLIPSISEVGTFFLSFSVQGTPQTWLLGTFIVSNSQISPAKDKEVPLPKRFQKYALDWRESPERRGKKSFELEEHGVPLGQWACGMPGAFAALFVKIWDSKEDWGMAWESLREVTPF